MKSCWRILDANLNRAREGLRVVEDVLRFQFDGEELVQAIRDIRHRLSLSPLPFACARDVDSDVGREKGGREEKKELMGVVVGNIRRVEEALRALEEIAKCVDIDSSLFEEVRYELYSIEQRILVEYFGTRRRFSASKGLYLIITPLSEGAIDVVRIAVRLGVPIVQLRDKDISDASFFKLALEARRVTDNTDTMLIINDRVDIAAAVGADGVHIGDSDLPPLAVRQCLPPDCILGFSTHSPAEVRQADISLLDYIAVGPVFKTRTKKDARSPLSREELSSMLALHPDIPKVVIGGLNEHNIPTLKGLGIKYFAVCSAVMGTEDAGVAIERIKEAISLCFT